MWTGVLIVIGYCVFASIIIYFLCKSAGMDSKNRPKGGATNANETDDQGD